MLARIVLGVDSADSFWFSAVVNWASGNWEFETERLRVTASRAGERNGVFEYQRQRG